MSDLAPTMFERIGRATFYLSAALVFLAGLAGTAGFVLWTLRVLGVL